MKHPVASPVGVIGALGAAGVFYASVIERNAFTVHRLTLPILHPNAPSIRVLHISDLHLAPWQQRKIRWVQSLAEWYPDVVVNTGDNFGYPETLPALQRALEPLLKLPGVYVDGSNDHFAPRPRNPFMYFAGPSTAHPADQETPLDVEGLHATFDEAGWQSLNNRAATSTINGTTIRWFGTGDAHRDADDITATAESLDHISASQDALNIGVTHAPYQAILDGLIELGADAIFAGHTHGGQVCIPGYGAILSNCDLPPKQASGLSSWTHNSRTVPLHVSNGLGTSVYAPVRFACRPSVTLLELQPRES